MPNDMAAGNRSLLIVDDERSILAALRRDLRGEGYSIFEAGSAIEGIEIFKLYEIGVVISDISMPEMDGLAFLEKVKETSADTVRILLTGNSTLDSAMTAINGVQVFGYLTKPWSGEGLRSSLSRAFEHYNLVKQNERLFELLGEQNRELSHFNANLENLVRERTHQMEEAIREGIQMLALAAEAKDDDTGEHVRRIQHLTKAIGLNLGMGQEESEKIGFFSMMHDIGKIHIPDFILSKTGSLSEGEWAIMKNHTVAGSKILGAHPFYQTARDIARSHHERWDGSGYPDGLKGDAIPLAARIVSVADVFDALTHARPYKAAWPVDRALKEMKDMAREAFDPYILESFLRNCSSQPLVITQEG